ncbi:MAG: hypothetical protein HY780_12730 [Chloroflexi bacterium]|nr:hypothetical protein [Chloroflexota bacterium]
MATLNTDQSFEQLLQAIRKLQPAQKMRLWQMLNAEFGGDEIRRRAAAAIEAIRAANEGVTEDEVMADVTAALEQVRAERRAHSS